MHHRFYQSPCVTFLTSAIITAKWSPSCCFLEKTESVYPLNDTRYDIYQRAPTIDGSNMNTTNKGIRGEVMSNLIDKICFNLSQQIKSVAEDKISVDRLVLHFKVSKKGVINFIMCSALKYTDITMAGGSGVGEQGGRQRGGGGGEGWTGGGETSPVQPEVRADAEKFDRELMVVARPLQLSKKHFCISCQNRVSRRGE